MTLLRSHPFHQELIPVVKIIFEENSIELARQELSSKGCCWSLILPSNVHVLQSVASFKQLKVSSFSILSKTSVLNSKTYPCGSAQ